MTVPQAENRSAHPAVAHSVGADEPTLAEKERINADEEAYERRDDGRARQTFDCEPAFSSHIYVLYRFVSFARSANARKRGKPCPETFGLRCCRAIQAESLGGGRPAEKFDAQPAADSIGVYEW